MYTFSCLDNSLVGSLYQSLTFPAYRSLLQLLQPQGAIVAIGVLGEQKQPIGLALAEILADGKSANLLSIFITKNYRFQGIGTALLTRLEAELKARNCQQVSINYTTVNPQISVLERVLQKCNWRSPQPRQLVCKCGHKMRDAHWVQKKYRLDSSFEIFLWRDMKKEERNLLLAQQQKADSWIPSELNPFHHERNLEPLNSLGLRYRHEVVGWVLTHRIAPDTIRYTCSYIRPDLQKLALILHLYRESILLHTAHPEIPEAIWTVPFIFNSMVNFVRKRFKPYMNSIEESRESSKLLIGKNMALL